MERGISFREKRGDTIGSLFANMKGGMMRSKNPETDILDKIDRIQQRYPELIRPGLEVHEEYGISRSFRRGSNLDAHNRGVKMGTSIVIIDGGRWKE